MRLVMVEFLTDSFIIYTEFSTGTKIELLRFFTIALHALLLPSGISGIYFYRFSALLLPAEFRLQTPLQILLQL